MLYITEIFSEITSILVGTERRKVGGYGVGEMRTTFSLISSPPLPYLLHSHDSDNTY